MSALLARNEDVRVTMDDERREFPYNAPGLGSGCRMRMLTLGL
jgi:hypothetical protein